MLNTMTSMQQQLALQQHSLAQATKVARGTQRVLSGANIPEGMFPAGFFFDNCNDYFVKIGLRAKIDSAHDPEAVRIDAINGYFGAKPGDAVGGLLSDPRFMIVASGVVTAAQSEQVQAFVVAVSDAVRGGGKGGRNDGAAVADNWPGSAAAEKAWLTVCATLPRMRRLAGALADRQETVRRANNPSEDTLKMMFFVTPALDPAAPEYEKQKYRRELLEERTTKVFHALFTYLFSITRGAPDADVDKYFVKQEGLYSERQVCKKAQKIFQDLFALRRKHKSNPCLGLLISLAYLERLARRGFADQEIDARSLLASDASIELDKLEATLGTSKDPSVLADKALKDAAAAKAENAALKKAVEKLEKKVADQKPHNDEALKKAMEAQNKRLQRMENWKANGGNGGDDGDGGGKGGGGKGGNRRNQRNQQQQAQPVVPGPAPAAVVPPP